MKLTEEQAQWLRDVYTDALLNAAYVESGGRVVFATPHAGDKDGSQDFLALAKVAAQMAEDILNANGLSVVPPGLRHGGRMQDLSLRARRSERRGAGSAGAEPGRDFPTRLAFARHPPH